MGIFSFLFGSNPEKNTIVSDGSYRFDIVGESHFQDNLEKIAGVRTADNKNHVCGAALMFDDQNRHDRNAVVVAIENMPVGYLSRDNALLFRQSVRHQGSRETAFYCRSIIVGGWNDGVSQGSYGVKLDIDYDFELT